MPYTYSDLTKNAYKPGEIAKMTGLHLTTLQRWDNEGRIKFDRNSTDRRYMTKENLIEFLKQENQWYESENLRKDIIYARVSTARQKEQGDLDRQVRFIIENNKDLIHPEIMKEVASGLNDNRPKFNRLIKMILNDEVGRIFITYKERLTRFGFNYVELMCQKHGSQIVVMQDIDKDKSIQEELAEDLFSVLASFSGKLYGLRSHQFKNKLKESESQNEEQS